MSSGTDHPRRAFLRRLATVALAIPTRRVLGVRAFTAASSQYFSTVITQANWGSSPWEGSIAVRCRTVSSAGQCPLSICSIVSGARMQLSVTTGVVQAVYSASLSSGVGAIHDGSWHTAVGTFSFSVGGMMTAQAWADGVGDTPISFSTVAMGTATPTVYVGARHNGTSLGLYWDGQISQVAYWNAALSADEIRQCGVGGPNSAGADFSKVGRALLDVADLSGEFSNSPWQRRASVLAPVNGPTGYTTSDARIIR